MLSSTDPITPVHNHGWCDALALSSETPGERVTREIADNLQRAGIVLEMYHAEAAPGQVSHLVPVIDCPDVDFAVHIFSMSSLQDHSHRCKQPMRWYPLVRSLWGPRIVMACGQLCLLGFLLIVVSIFLQAKRLNTRKFKLTHSTRWKCSACSHLNKANRRKQEGLERNTSPMSPNLNMLEASFLASLLSIQGHTRIRDLPSFQKALISALVWDRRLAGYHSNSTTPCKYIEST